ncbi:MAG: 30S ribosomal protein S8 [Planctomycetes bacterium]|nr:30S ribosomal protein S8 [Planctomycetota bacterium]
MSMTDPIADMITRMRNAHSLGRRRLEVPYSRIKERLAEVLKREGYISGFEGHGEGVGRSLRIELRYDADGGRLIRHISRVSRPGCRVYRGYGQLGRVMGGLGIYVLSTPEGLKTDQEARKGRLGGEVLIKVY